ncbi:hypothetical protein IC614_02460 [Allosphingosinicella flava]|uniref:DUF11 domain-containing protein n=2 Tax=Allosphingosinicella flava TaxID=2771430 RepID=A0A7T2GLS2_9SPHN|nr:hypothetical protein IC614_02460 [Sphingosinicella flava]
MNCRYAAGVALFRIKHILAAGTFLSGLHAAPSFAQGTAAGTQIDNKATATYDTGNGATTVDSNTVSLRVDELLNVTVASADTGNVQVTPGATNRVLRFTVTNSGNGSEAFRLSASGTVGGDDFNPTVTSIVLDTNNNGVYDSGVDTVYVAGSNDPVLAADGSIRVFVLATIPAGAANGDEGIVELTATANTGSGTPGTTFAGQGQGGGDAIVGATSATATDEGTYAVSQATVAITKSATVVDPFGGATLVPGSIITYRLSTTVSGSGSLANLRVSDIVPAGTTYEAGSITLDGAALTDATGDDTGSYTSGTRTVLVSLGTVAAGTTHEVTFDVEVD